MFHKMVSEVLWLCIISMFISIFSNIDKTSTAAAQSLNSNISNLSMANIENKVVAPVIAIVIDDLGHSQSKLSHFLNIHEPITLAFLPYPKRANELATLAKNKGKEIILHLPMEANDPNINPGPSALRSELKKNYFLLF